MDWAPEWGFRKKSRLEWWWKNRRLEKHGWASCWSLSFAYIPHAAIQFQNCMPFLHYRKAPDSKPYSLSLPAPWDPRTCSPSNKNSFISSWSPWTEVRKDPYLLNYFLSRILQLPACLNSGSFSYIQILFLDLDGRQRLYSLLNPHSSWQTIF